MPSYTSSLRLVQPATGEYSGTWGDQVNTGLTALVDTSVAGTATITMVAADYTLSTANGTTDEARAAILNVTGTPGAARNIIVPALSKLYVVYNNTSGGFAQTVKTASGTGISVPNGATAYLRCDGTNVVAAVNYLGSLTLGAALPTASGGTGSTSTTYCSLTANVTGTLPVGNGGTGAATFTANNVLLGNGTSAFQVVAPGASGNVLTSNGTTWISAAIPSAVTSISFGTTGLTPSTATSGAVTVAGTLAVANGGTGLSTLTAANRIPYASGTTTLTTSAGLTFDGTNFATTGTATAASFIPTSSTIPTNGMYLAAANTLNFSTNSTNRWFINSSGQLQTAGLNGLTGTYTPAIISRHSTSGNPGGAFWSVTNNIPALISYNQATTGDNAFVEFGTEGTYTARGSITYNRAGGLVAYNTTSDYRAKDIIGQVQNPGATIDALKVYEGLMKGATQSRPMLIAHEAQAHAPYAVSGVKDEMNEDGTPRFQQMDVSALVPLLLAEIQSLRARVAVLEMK